MENKQAQTLAAAQMLQLFTSTFERHYAQTYREAHGVPSAQRPAYLAEFDADDILEAAKIKAKRLTFNELMAQGFSFE